MYISICIHKYIYINVNIYIHMYIYVCVHKYMFNNKFSLKVIKQLTG